MTNKLRAWIDAVTLELGGILVSATPCVVYAQEAAALDEFLTAPEHRELAWSDSVQHVKWR